MWLKQSDLDHALAYDSRDSRFALATKRTPRRLVVASSSTCFGFKFGFELEFKFGFEFEFKFGFEFGFKFGFEFEFKFGFESKLKFVFYKIC